jgi:hypothetical protein
MVVDSNYLGKEHFQETQRGTLKPQTEESSVIVRMAEQRYFKNGLAKSLLEAV